MHNCLLPAIDRAAVVQNRLKVLNRMPAVRLLNIDQSVFTRMNDTLDTLRLLGHATMKFAATESRQFDAFAPWLQKTLQCANGETRSTTGEYLIDKLADADLLQILPYITGALNESKLEVLLASASIDMVKMVAKDAPVMVKDDITDLMIKHRDNTLPKDTKHSPEIDILFHGLRWRAHVERVIEAVQKEFMQSVKKQQQPSQTQLSRIMDIRSERRIQSSDSMPGKVDQDVIFTAGAVAGMNNTSKSPVSAPLDHLSDTKSDHLVVVNYSRSWAGVCSHDHYLRPRKPHADLLRRFQFPPRAPPHSK